MSDETIRAMRYEFEKLKSMAERAMGQLDETAFFQPLGQDGNSVAVLVKHMAGNMWSRWRDFLTTDGEKPDRNRDQEFELTPEESRESLMRAWERGWQTLFGALNPLVDKDLAQIITIRGESHRVDQAILRQVSHSAFHSGQIVMVCKYLTAENWQTLTVARGESENFNINPKKYLNVSK